MNTKIYALLFMLSFIVGCKSSKVPTPLTPEYGEKDNELKIGEGLKGIVNAHNESVYAPWYRNVEKDSKWGKYKVTFKRLLTLRAKPDTYLVMLAVCEPINKQNPKLSWIYRDDLKDGRMYKNKELILQDGVYMIAYKTNPKDNSINIQSIKR